MTLPNLNRDNATKYLLLISSLVFSFLLACYIQKRVFFDPTAINNDVRIRFIGWLD